MTGRAYYQFLLERYVAEEATEAEIAELFEELKKFKDDEAWTEMIEAITAKGEADADYDRGRWEKMILKIIERDDKKEFGIGDSEQDIKDAESGYFKKTSQIRGIRRVFRYAVAAGIIGFLIWSVVFLVGRDNRKDPSVAISPKEQDIKSPESTKATITLADGRQVYLDSVVNGVIAIQENLSVTKNEEGQIIYSAVPDSYQRSNVNREIMYNTLVNPRGSRVVHIQLTDGTKVWLNAGSSLKYPVVFNGDKREVELEGEGYFEVNTVNHHSSIVKGASENSKRTTGGKVPFFVRSGEVVTEVLGTQFNVNAYEDEGEVRVTLLEGRVNVSRESSSVNREGVKRDPAITSSVKLLPGQQAKAMSNKLSVMSGVDVEQVMAWKGGKFYFRSADIYTVLRQAARWYDVEVQYRRHINKKFNGEVSRNITLLNFLKVLELSGNVEFEVQGKKLIVK